MGLLPLLFGMSWSFAVLGFWAAGLGGLRPLKAYIYIYIYIYIYMCVCVCACICTYIYIHTYIRLFAPFANSQHVSFSSFCAVPHA